MGLSLATPHRASACDLGFLITQGLCSWSRHPEKESQREAALPFIVYPQCDTASHLLHYVE